MNTVMSDPGGRVVRVLEPAGNWQGYATKAIVYEILLAIATSGAARFSIAGLAEAVGAPYHTVQDGLRRLCARGLVSRRWLPGQQDKNGREVFALSVAYQAVHLTPHVLAPDRRPVSIYWLTSESEEDGAVYSVPVDRLRPHVAKVLGFVRGLAGASGALATSARIVARACSLTPGIAAQALRELETSGHVRRLTAGGVPTAPGLVLYQLVGSSAPSGSGPRGVCKGLGGQQPGQPLARRLEVVPEQVSAEPMRRGSGQPSGSRALSPWQRSQMGAGAPGELLRPYSVVYEAHPLPAEAAPVPVVGVAA